MVTVLCLSHKTHSVHGALSESEMRAKLAEYNRDAIKLCNRNAKSHWAVATDVGNKEKQKENVILLIFINLVLVCVFIKF